MNLFKLSYIKILLVVFFILLLGFQSNALAITQDSNCATGNVNCSTVVSSTHSGWSSFTGTIGNIFQSIFGIKDKVVAPVVNYITNITNAPSPVVTPPTTIIQQISQAGLTGNAGPQGLRGFTGPQGPRGQDGSSSNIDTSLFISKSFLTSQVDRIYDSISNSLQGLSTSLSEEVDTALLKVNGNTSITGDTTLVGLLNVTGDTTINGVTTLNGNTSITSTNTFTVGTGLATLGGGLNVAGNVGIGTTVPTQKLDVAGNINISSGSAYMYNGVKVINAQTALGNYFFGNSGNLTMTGENNISIGDSAFGSNTTGHDNVAIGVYALRSNTNGSNNVALGSYSTMYRNTDGNNNIAIGQQALFQNTTGSQNVAVGFNTLYDITTGIGKNTAIGQNTGRGITTGSNNTILGANVIGLAAGLSNNIILANGAGTIKAQNDGTNWNLTGNVGIGISPTALLHIKAGTATANTAPLKFTSGALLMTPEAGAVEYDNSGYYGTVSLNVGDSYGGGKIAYILQPSDPGYDPTQIKGIIAATDDQGRIRWYNGSVITTGATATALGTGMADTNTIIASQGPITISYAAGLARAYTGGGYTDWYLPSQDELVKLYLNRAAIGGFGTGTYWSSSESSLSAAWSHYFNDGSQYSNNKNNAAYVRAIRSFAINSPRQKFAFNSDLTSMYVPYTGGNSNLDLGVHNLTVDTNSLFVDSVNHKVGIGTITPAAKLDITGNVAIHNESANGLDIYTHSSTSFRVPTLHLIRSNGTQAAPTVVTSGLNLGEFAFLGHDGSTYSLGSSLNSFTTENWTSSTHGSDLRFLTVTTGSNTATEKMRISGTGSVGIGTTTPTSILHTVASGAKTAAYTGNLLTNTATSSTASIAKIGLDVQSTGTWNGTIATNTGLNVNVSGGTTNYAAAFMGGNVGIGTNAPVSKLSIGGAGNSDATLYSFSDWGFGGYFTSNHNFAILTGSGAVGIGSLNGNNVVLEKLEVHGGNILVSPTSNTTGGVMGKIGFGPSGVYNGLPSGAYMQGDYKGSSWSAGTKLTFYTAPGPDISSGGGPVARLTINSDGSVGIGTTTPASLLEIQGGLTTTGALLTLGTKEPSVVANDILGQINFYAPLDTGVDSILTGASIAAIAEGTFSDTSNATSLQFRTGASEIATTKMTILSSGNVGIGATSPTNILHVTGTPVAGTHVARIANTLNGTTQNNGLLILAGNDTGEAVSELITFKRPDNTTIGTITQTGAGAIAFNSGSDRRIKDEESIKPTIYGLSDLLNIKVDDFTFISDPNKQKMTGFIAQELNTIYPGAVTTNGDNGTEALAQGQTPWMIDYSKLTPLIVKGVQDLNLKVENLSSLDTTSATSLGSLITSFLENASNEVMDFFANRVHTKQLCISNDSGETCITREQLDVLVSGAGGSNSGSGNGGSGGSGSASEQPATCTDGIQNQNETGVDTGGVCTQTPPADPTCTAPQTLVNHVCTDPVVPPTCTDPQVLVNGVCADPTPAQ